VASRAPATSVAEPGRLLPCTQAPPISIPMVRPVRQMQRALAHWPGPAGHHPGDPAALTVPCPRRREGAWEDLAQLHSMSGQARPGVSRWPHCACLLPLGQWSSWSPSAGLGPTVPATQGERCTCPEPFRTLSLSNTCGHEDRQPDGGAGTDRPDLRGPCFEQLISDRRTDRAVLYAYPAGRPQGGGCGGVSVTI
jgi:hypothetical protein